MRMSAAEFRQMAKPKPSKYGNEPVWIDGIRFDSKAEGKRYAELKLLQAAGEIAELKFQPKFKMTVPISAIFLIGTFKMRKRLMPSLTVDGDFLTQKRLKKEWDYVSEKRNKNAANGARGGRPKANINNRFDQANVFKTKTQTISETKAPITQNPIP